MIDPLKRQVDHLERSHLTAIEGTIIFMSSDSFLFSAFVEVILFDVSVFTFIFVFVEFLCTFSIMTETFSCETNGIST